MGYVPDLTKGRALRRFTRFYLRQIRPLRDVMQGPSMHRSYLRVLRELGEAPGGICRANIAWNLDMDRALVTRITEWYRALGYLESEERSPRDGRVKLVRLNARGRAAFERMEHQVLERANFMVATLFPPDQQSLLDAMHEIERILRAANWETKYARPAGR